MWMHVRPSRPCWPRPGASRTCSGRRASCRAKPLRHPRPGLPRLQGADARQPDHRARPRARDDPRRRRGPPATEPRGQGHHRARRLSWPRSPLRSACSREPASREGRRGRRMPRTISNRVGLGLHGSQSEKMGSVARAPVFVPVRERHVASARIHHERVLLVRRGGQTRVAWFIQWSAGEEGMGSSTC